MSILELLTWALAALMTGARKMNGSLAHFPSDDGLKGGLAAYLVSLL